MKKSKAENKHQQTGYTNHPSHVDMVLEVSTRHTTPLQGVRSPLPLPLPIPPPPLWRVWMHACSLRFARMQNPHTGAPNHWGHFAIDKSPPVNNPLSMIQNQQ
ncbi:uncharacterized protein BDCG_08020 [Blastomyces dermatitidis ER-3]|uniref:Uncharacterized protein n=1 Tax=Ajellomyces dermatitidis (strain ER-3 / ATCC MYA-2586) TaxID=559297 RepID=A0ABX2VZV7_AJEDR|nr:uncharacterized protein BDCG_08020 [Blastomyces dermatitidis ER-3]OAT02669.1 hypothetical protein BDCG_08020 [Blastomyces dermatitidis ER-3]